MLDNWQERFPNCEPVSHLMRTAFRKRWVRFHSLPESKRYPENEGEYETVLHRHNRILGELVGSERGVALLTTGYSETPQPVRTYPELDAFDPNAKLWRTVAMHELERDFSDPNYWHVFASGWEWRRGLFDPLVRLVADGTVANVMIVDLDCRWLLHPYDGGMDVILDSPAARGRLRAIHKDWLSLRADGL
ncbi:MAG: hypothetical protein J0I06_00525 [Planctomycetes bacterium]|nr:hypothetical protein [Planctomycetota bacterium]